MRERAEALGADFRLLSEPGAETVVEVVLSKALAPIRVRLWPS